MKVTLTFWNGTDGATGSEFMLDDGVTRLLIDCGLTQGIDWMEERNSEDFAHDPKETDFLLVTHAHMDHIGRIPKFVKDGFHGRIISTFPTRDLAELMFQDALKIMSLKELQEGEEPLYTKDDADKALMLWDAKKYHEVFPLGGFKIEFSDAGHILGSATISIRGENKEIIFSGDLGNTPHDLLADTELPQRASYLVMESVYGNRNHSGRDVRSEDMKKIITDVIQKKGVLIIPVFSIERSQDILFELNKLVESKEIPEVPVFLDSPLAIKVTEVYRSYKEWFNTDIQSRIQNGDDVFSFPGLTLTHTKEDSKTIKEMPGPKIVIAGSGMSHGGRVQYHEMDYLSNPNNTILFVGYQIPGSVGRRILDGEKNVKIFKKEVKVRARVESIFSYSAHKDMDHLVEFASRAKDLEKLFIVLGEPQSRMFLAQRLYEYHGIKAELPERLQSFEIEL